MPVTPIGEIHTIGEEIGEDITLDDQFGADGDIAVNKGDGIIYQKLSGTWGQVYPALIL